GNVAVSAAALAPGDRFTAVFRDGEVPAVAVGGPGTGKRRQGRKSAKDRGPENAPAAEPVQETMAI
ncbi:MAG: hypothetical protein IJ783_00335, partial [Kiritimatiellae bacterium]|nr:hypothetical protein [Kiritimatiellia bacterium]